MIVGLLPTFASRMTCLVDLLAKRLVFPPTGKFKPGCPFVGVANHTMERIPQQTEIGGKMNIRLHGF